MKVWVVTEKFESDECYSNIVGVNVFDSYDKAYSFMTSVFDKTVKDNMDTYGTPDSYVRDKEVFENSAFFCLFPYGENYADEYISYEWSLDEREVK